jgi:cytochrome oxidase Cu insertion factor (SCO1/SenC/PrrC family)
MSEINPNIRKRNNRLVILLFIIVFAGPLLFAWVLLNKSEQREFRQSNHGELISPTRDISEIELYDSKNKVELTWNELGDKWWLVYLGPNSCNEDCHEILYNMRQIRTALNKNSSRLERMFLTIPECDMSGCDQYLLEHYPDMYRFRISNEQFKKAFEGVSDPLMRKSVGELYIVDPQGRLMMQYDGETEVRGILSDLRRLLRMSKIG